MYLISKKSSKRIGSSLLVAAAVGLSLSLSACMSTVRTQGYDIPEDALVQVRPGTSKEVVNFVLGTPQSTNTFGDTEVYYYIETKVEETSFKYRTPLERTVLAVYFDKNDRVKEKAIYALKDGRVFNTVTRRTISFGSDTNFVSQLLSGLMG